LHLNLVLNGEKQNLLHMACMGGSVDVLDMMLEYAKVKERLETRDCQRRTPLHYAAAMGYDAVVEKLLSRQADVDPQDDAGATPLMLAVRFDWISTARLLVDRGANPMLEDFQGYNSVDVALSKEGELSELLAGFASQRRQTTLLQSLRNLVFPVAKLRPVPHLPREAEDEQPGPVAPVFYDDIVGEHLEPPPASEVEAHNALDEAVGSSKRPATQNDDAGITLDVADPKPVTSPSSRAAEQSFSFDASVQKLEFEVEWQEGCPAVGMVKAGGQAARRGLAQGDEITEIAGVRTAGKGREQLLPLMKQRPLTVKVARKGGAAHTTA